MSVILQFKNNKNRGAWVAQSVKRLTLDLGSERGLPAHEIEPHIGLCTVGVEPAWDSPSPSLPVPPSLFLKTKINFYKKKNKNNKNKY